ncbi:hypothetical protein NGA_2126000, partial [Nannochloropsis gaditana CCMP526]|uniref:uncharacterized protein n=1 Tax=Nannochloropsis gaditana (strain CCMP526) TaxID=1093141 RepID=UPI00029F7DEC
ARLSFPPSGSRRSPPGRNGAQGPGCPPESGRRSLPPDTQIGLQEPLPSASICRPIAEAGGPVAYIPFARAGGTACLPCPAPYWS